MSLKNKQLLTYIPRLPILIEKLQNKLPWSIMKNICKESENSSLKVSQDKPVTLAQSCHNLAKSLKDEEWLTLLIESTKQPVAQGIQMPGFPDDQLQRTMVGSVGEHALREAFRFWQEIKRYFKTYGAKQLHESYILDFGSGWGRYIRLFLKDVPPEQILGVDVDSDFVALSTQLLPGVTFKVVPPLPPSDLPGNHFDLIYAYSVFSHLAEDAHQAWISEFARVLKPGGIIVVTTQRRGFIDFCESLRQEETQQSLWHEALSRSFLDVKAAKQDYDEGRFLYSATGGGGPRDSSFYGEAIVSPAYVGRTWVDRFEILDFVDDETRCPQAVIVARKKMTGNDKVIYISENLVQVAGINFRISTTDYSISTDELNVALLKPTSFLEYYENMIFRENVRNVVEFGIFEGGMAVFLTSLKKDLHYLGIDLKSPVTGLQNFLNNHDEIAQRIVTQYNMGQSDARVPKLIIDFLKGEALDLIIDDASHEYFFSRKTFELCFPLLKDGGLYIIEDWGWLHWIGFEIPAQWKDSPALTNLVIELIMLCASRPGLIAEIDVFFNMVIIKKGKEQIKGDFALEDFIQMNRRKIVFL